MDSNAPHRKIVHGNRQRGAEVHIDQNGNAEISLLDNALLSSLHYATAHIFLNSLIEDAEGGGTSSSAVQQQIKADLQTLREFAEAQRHKLPLGTDGQEWQAVTASGKLTDEQLKTLHEVTAIAYVKYLMRGEAPSSGLENAFSSIKDMLQEEGSSSLPDINLSPEVAQVFNRMLATDSEMQSKNVPRQLADQPARQPTSRLPATPTGICAKVLSRETTITRRIGLLCIAVGITFLFLGLVTWNRYDLYNLEESHGIMMLLGTILAPVGALLYSGMADRLFLWVKTGK